ncbi:MAG: AEC family transporter [Dehalococcoidia bacterium]|nr:AEC family transporter [Dehalococcoidia bacterium]
MLQIFADVVLPVFVVAGVGFLAQRILKMQILSLSQAVIYIFSPALVFTGLTNSSLSGEHAAKIVIYSVVFSLVTLLLSWPVSKLLRLKGADQSGFFLGTMFPNAGNYGLSVVLLAFQQAGLDSGLIFFVCQAILGGTLAVFLASRGSTGSIASLKQVLKMPQMYAALLAIAADISGVTIPEAISKPATILGQAAIPSMLIVLGMQLAQVKGLELPVAMGTAVAMRLVLSAIIAFGITGLLGMEDLTRKVLIIQSSMPTAVFVIIVATQFNASPRFVTGVVVISTLVSILTVTVILTLLTSNVLGI